jgi:hypothetical protein
MENVGFQPVCLRILSVLPKWVISDTERTDVREPRPAEGDGSSFHRWPHYEILCFQVQYCCVTNQYTGAWIKIPTEMRD